MISSPKSRSFAWLHAVSKMLLSKMCSRDRTGSMSVIPISPKIAVTVLEICSRRDSSFPAQARSGAAKEDKIEIGRPASDPGV